MAVPRKEMIVEEEYNNREITLLVDQIEREIDDQLRRTYRQPVIICPVNLDKETPVILLRHAQEKLVKRYVNDHCEWRSMEMDVRSASCIVAENGRTQPVSETNDEFASQIIIKLS